MMQWFRLCLFALWVGLLSVSAGAEESLRDFPVQVPVEVQGQGPWYRLELPMAIHLAARYPDLRDLRVFNAKGEELAYAITRSSARSERQQQAHSVKWFPLRGAVGQKQEPPDIRIELNAAGTVVQVGSGHVVNAGQYLRGWLLDVSHVGAPLEKLSLEWDGGAEGFQQFTIEASDDFQSWRSWGMGQLTRLAFAGERIDQGDVHLPGERARYIRLLWQEPQEVPQLTAAQVQSTVLDRHPPAVIWSEAMSPTVVGDGEYSWVLPVGLPVERVRISMEQLNTLVPVRLEGRSEDNKPWQYLVSGVLYRLLQSEGESVRDELELPGFQVFGQLRLKSDPRGNGFGNHPPSLQVGMRATDLVFLARGEGPFVLALGNPAAQSAEMPLQVLIPDYSEEKLAGFELGRLGAISRSAVSSAPVSLNQEGASWRKLGLWAVLLVGVGVLGAMAFSLVRKPPASEAGREDKDRG